MKLDIDKTNFRHWIPRNLKGRDFAVGDLHGCYSLLQQLLTRVGFDKTKDRLFSVGDIVDRAFENVKCFELLAASWFFAVKGNHELLAQMAEPGYFMSGLWEQNGGGWEEYISAGYDPSFVIGTFEELPAALTVETENGYFHVLHAEAVIPPDVDWDETLLDDEALYRACTVPSSMGECHMWARRVFGSFNYADLNNPKTAQRAQRGAERYAPSKRLKNPVFSGHTICQQIVDVNGLINLDTGGFMAANKAYRDVPKAGEWAGLSIYEVATGAAWTAHETGVKEAQIFRYSPQDGV